MANSPNAPLTIGRYALHAQIASGGMASVHFARLLGPGGFSRVVAAKRLLPRMLKNRAFTTMLMDEARLAARIRHPNVLSTLDVVSADGELVVVMEYVHGEALSQLAQRAGDLGEPISPQLATCIVIDALHGLHAAHEATDQSGQPLGLVHRDISPQNLLVGLDGVTRVADFGIAKAAGRSYETLDGTIKGKLGYMAPEQLERDEVTRATDVFAISVVLWELLTGRQLFAGGSEGETVYRVLTCDIPRPSSLVPDLAVEYDRILLKGLSRDPSQRYCSARQMALELGAITPPLRASDIGAWVERVASNTLQERSQLISKIESGLSTDDAALAPPQALAPIPDATPEPPHDTAVDVSHVAGLPRRGAAWVSLLVVSGLALAGLSALLWMPRGEPAVPAGDDVAARNPAPSTTVTSKPEAPSEMSGPSTPAAVSGSALRPEPAPSPAPVHAAKAGTSGSKAAAAHHDKLSTSPDCDPPYAVDAAGRRLFKLECM